MKSTATTSISRLAAGVIMVGFPSHTVPGETRQLIERGVRCFVLFARNAGPRERVQALTAELRDLAGDDAIIAIDHEGGRVNRLREAASPWPSPMAWAATGDLRLARDASRVAAEELAALGITLNLAPVADVLTYYQNPVLTTRCFSDDPGMTADFVAAFVTGHTDAGVGTSVKHFPGHGGTMVDSHIDLPRVEHSPTHLLSHDMVPFVAAKEAGVTSLMVSHVWYARIDQVETSATVSPAVIRLARESLGFEGPIITDSMEMGAITTRMSMRDAAVRALPAGCDLVTVSHDPDRQREVLDEMIEAVENGTLPMQRLHEANRRIEMLRPHSGFRPTPFPTGGAALAEEISRRAVTLVRDKGRHLPLRFPSEMPVGVVTFPGFVSSAAENVAMPASLLAEAVRSFHASVIDVVLHGQEDPVERLAGVETVIVGTAGASANPEQAVAVRRLVEAGKQVIVVGLRDPFDILSFPDVPCYLAAFDDSLGATRAAAAVIFGQADAGGRLTVEIPGMYERGHGLRRT